MPITRSRDSSFLSISVVCVIMTLSLRLLRPAARAQCRVTGARRWRGYATVEVPASKLSFGQPLHETHPHLLKPGESATITSCLTRTNTEQWRSYTQYYCTRILQPSPEARRTATAELNRYPRWCRPEVRLGCCLLQVPPGPRLPLLDWYIRHMTHKSEMVTDEARLQRTGCARNH